MSQAKVLLALLDGYGEGPEGPGNAIRNARTPFLDSLASSPSCLLAAHGEAVGLPVGAMGSSEVGHSTIGAARAILQPLLFIDQKIADGTFAQNKAISAMLTTTSQAKTGLHVIGLLSDGGIHSHLRHLDALLAAAAQAGIAHVYVHAIADGRDVRERSFATYAQHVETMFKTHGVGELVDFVGRFFAMDRDQNWERTQTAYDLYTHGSGEQYTHWQDALSDLYQEDDESDYYLPPVRFSQDPNSLITADDSVVFFNFRSDRAKQLTALFTDPTLTKPNRNFVLPAAQFVGFGPFGDFATTAFDPMDGITTIGELIAQHGLKQLRVAETEKYAHVTYFMNCQTPEPYPGEERILIDSNKCASHAEKPAMKAAEITDAVLDSLREEYALIVANYANMDLVGHSGEYDATVQACEAADTAISRLIPPALAAGYIVLVVGDHGNAEAMLTPDGKPNPSHTTNPTRLHVLTPKGSAEIVWQNLSETPSLAHLGATILTLLGVEKANEMTSELF